MTDEWGYPDALLLASVVLVRGEPGHDLASVLKGIDYLERIVASAAELERGFNRLLQGGLVERADVLVPSPLSLQLWERASAAEHLRAGVERLLTLLNDEVPAPLTDERSWRLGPDAYAEAVALYRRRFAEELEGLDGHQPGR